MRAAAALASLIAVVAAPAQTEAAGKAPTSGKPAPVERVLIGTEIGLALASAANGFCAPVLSGDVAWPAELTEQSKLLGKHHLSDGVPSSAIEELGPAASLFSRATLAHRKMGNDEFALALGPQPTCRLILYKTGDPIGAQWGVLGGLIALGWREVPGTSLPTVTKRMFLIRSKTGRPMLINILFPTNPAAKPPLIVTVAQIPPHVALPVGF